MPSRSGRLSALVRPTISGLEGKVRRSSRATLGHVRDHACDILGFSFIDAACFTHSVFTGLLVTGISWFAYGWKVSE